MRGPLAAALLLSLSALAARAEPLRPAADDEVVEQLPAAGRAATEERQARRALRERPDDVALALRVAQAGLERSRAGGDPRHAGQALAALAHWSDAASAPIPVLLLQATLQQHLHDFDAAAARLEQLLRREPRHAQAWLTLAGVRRVQGRYADADTACRGLAASGATLHASACAAENAGLRGRFAPARASLQGLLATRGLDAATAAWLWTTLAELEQRAGDARAAEAAWRRAVGTAPDPYAALGWADFLLSQGRAAEARATLAGQPASDAVVLRRAMAGDAAAASEVRARFAQSAQRPQTQQTHGRELALLALHVERDAPRALELARGNVAHQREPADLQLLADAARAAGNRAALDDARREAASQGLVDRRWTEAENRSPS